MTSTWDPVFAVQSRADVAQGLMDQPSCTSNHVAPMLADRGRAGRGGGVGGGQRRKRRSREDTGLVRLCQQSRTSRYADMRIPQLELTDYIYIYYNTTVVYNTSSYAL